MKHLASSSHLRCATPLGRMASIALPAVMLLLTTPVLADTPATAPTPPTMIHSVQQCGQLQDDDAARLACYDQWAAQQRAREDAAPSAAPAATTTAQTPGATPPASEARAPTTPSAHGEPTIVVASNDGCRNPVFDATSRMWELTSDTDCGNFRFRGYRPLTVGVAAGNRVNRQPYSPSPENGLGDYRDYQHQEARIQLSMRTKLASNLLTHGHATKRDSLWFGYTFNAYWQAFNDDLSRPFRNTDHEPEFLYVYPLEWKLLGSARLRYAGLGLNHQSNGQSNPLSRSWNRYYAMLGMDVTPNWSLQGRYWHRLSENPARDDNPGIDRYIGRAELTSVWDINQRNTLSTTLRHSLRDGRGGSARLEWYRSLGEGFAGGRSNLQLYTGLFHGYGDSLIDYNYKRTVFTIGFSLLDF